MHFVEREYYLGVSTAKNDVDTSENNDAEDKASYKTGASEEDMTQDENKAEVRNKDKDSVTDSTAEGRSAEMNTIRSQENLNPSFSEINADENLNETENSGVDLNTDEQITLQPDDKEIALQEDSVHIDGDILENNEMSSLVDADNQSINEEVIYEQEKAVNDSASVTCSVISVRNNELENATSSHKLHDEAGQSEEQNISLQEAEDKKEQSDSLMEMKDGHELIGASIEKVNEPEAVDSSSENKGSELICGEKKCCGSPYSALQHSFRHFFSALQISLLNIPPLLILLSSSKTFLSSCSICE